MPTDPNVSNEIVDKPRWCAMIQMLPRWRLTESNTMTDEPSAINAEELLRRERWPIVRNELPGVCEELARLLPTGYTYSLRYIAQQLEGTERVEAIMRSLDSSHRFATDTAAVLRLFEELDVQLDGLHQWETVFAMLLDIVSQIHRLAVEPLVQIVREAGSAERHVFDGYVDFRRRWNEQVMRIQELGKLVGIRRDLSMFLATELGVQVRS